MRTVILYFLVCLLGSTSAAQAISFSEVTSAEGKGEAFNFDRTMSDYFDALAGKRLDKARKATAAVRENAPNPRLGQALAQLLEAPIAAAQNKDDKARDLLAAGEAASPDTPELLGLTLPAFLYVERADFAGTTVDRMIARAPDLVRGLEPDLVYLLLDDTGEAQSVLDDRRIALAELNFGGADGDYLASSAVGVLMKRDQIARALKILPDIDSPRHVENLLILRRFAPLWPALAAQAGPGLSRSRESSVRLARQEYEADVSDPRKLAALFTALRYARRYPELWALKEKLPATPKEMAKADEQMGWAVNEMALALHQDNRGDEADRLFASLNDSLPANDWRVSMFINRTALLMADGKFAEALPLIERAEKEPKSPFAAQLLRRWRYCALVRLSRATEAAALRTEMMKNADAAKAATVEGLLCAGEVDEAEKLALGFLADDDFQKDFVRSLQRKRLTDVEQTAWGNWTALRSRPAISAAFEKYGRDLPDDLLISEGTN